MLEENRTPSTDARPSSRMTRQRAVILKELCALKTHPTADEIYHIVRGSLPHISLGTVYRNLDHLVASGSILKLEKAGSQKRFDGNPVPHQHIRCDICGRISDVMPEIPVPPLTEEVLQSIADTGFKFTGAFIELVGICPDCAAVKPS